MSRPDQQTVSKAIIGFSYDFAVWARDPNNNAELAAAIHKALANYRTAFENRRDFLGDPTVNETNLGVPAGATEEPVAVDAVSTSVSASVATETLVFFSTMMRSAGNVMRKMSSGAMQYTMKNETDAFYEEFPIINSVTAFRIFSTLHLLNGRWDIYSPTVFSLRCISLNTSILSSVLESFIKTIMPTLLDGEDTTVDDASVVSSGNSGMAAGGARETFYRVACSIPNASLAALSDFWSKQIINPLNIPGQALEIYTAFLTSNEALNRQAPVSSRTVAI